MVLDAKARGILTPDTIIVEPTSGNQGVGLALIGAVTPANAVIGSDEEWDAQCRDQIDAMAADGGFLLATGCEYPANASFDRARRMIDIAKTYGTYQK